MNPFVRWLVCVVVVSVPRQARTQTTPFSGNIDLRLQSSSLTLCASCSINIDVIVDASAATGTCQTGGGSTPFTLGAFNLGVTYEGGIMQFVSAAACPGSPSQLASAPSCGTISSTPPEVACSNSATGNANQPQGSMCVLRLTFLTPEELPIGGTETLRTRNDPAPRGIASHFVVTPTNCGGAKTFPHANITDAVLGLPWAVTLTPTTTTRAKNTLHTATATVRSAGSVMGGEVVTFTVTSGPNTGVTGQGTTNAQGQTAFSYTSTVTGTDKLRASITKWGATAQSSLTTINWTN